MLRFAQICDAVAATARKLEKTALVATYLRSLPPDEAATAAIFFSGRPFAAHQETTLQVGGALLWRVISELSGKSSQQLDEIYRQHGDAGASAADALPQKPESNLSLREVQQAFFAIAAARGPAAKSSLVRSLLERAIPVEAKYIIKIITGDLRIGLKESLVEEAIALAFEAPLDQVKRANMLLGDLGETLHLASTGNLAEARLRLFHPLGFMLASPVESAVDALSYFPNASVEDKYDGIRAQAHISRGEVHLFSRTRDEITEAFPEIPPALVAISATAKDAILDGEILAWSIEPEPPDPDTPVPAEERTSAGGRALPFSALQQRLGRKKVSAKLMRDIPVAYVVFDVLYADGELLLDAPLRDRARVLDRLLPAPMRLDREQPVNVEMPVPGQSASAPLAGAAQSQFSFASSDVPRAPILRAPVQIASSPADLDSLFAAARDRGNEGLMIKDLDSPYSPGRRGKSWLKMKRELATLDVVVTSVEYGHGKRIGVLSDYTFAVWDADRLVNIGKAYSGLTDAEIAAMTTWFLAHKISQHGLRLEVEPRIVLEVAFNNMMRSERHESGYALRFPRIVRLRPDKLAEDADTIATVREIFARQQ